MLEFKDNPRELMRSLDRFLSIYFGDWTPSTHRERQVEYKPNLDEIAAWNIPQPLKDLYSFIGKFQGQSGFLESNQDSLIINPGNFALGGKLYIVAERSGSWTCCTEFEGEDPPVWTEDRGWQADAPKWKLVNRSLSQFLVGFCLKEAIMASRYRQKIGSFHTSIPSAKVIAAIENRDCDVSLLWQDTWIWEAMYDEPEYIVRFYSVEEAILFDGSHCATNYKNAERLICSLQSEFE